MPKAARLLTLQEAVGEFIRDGDEVLLGGFAMSDPVAFAHELIRQGRRDLDLIKTSGGLIVDQLVGAGCVRTLLCCHVWNSVGPEPAHCFRRAVGQGTPRELELEELSFGAMTTGFAAAAWGLPFMPTTPLTLTGHDVHRTHRPDKLATVVSPFPPHSLVTVVKPIAPKLGVFHVHRVDEAGNAQLFGPTAEFRQSIAACERVIVIAEELVPSETIRERPELTIALAAQVDAVVIEPWAAHPTDSHSYYARDLDFHAYYAESTRTESDAAAYLADWIHGTANHTEFVGKLGTARLESLRLREPWW
jgi:glutaconate CoA-transferase, subunit A